MSTPYSWTIPTPPYEAPIYGTETWDTRYGLKGTGSGQDAQNIAIEPVSKHGVRYSSGQYQYEEVDLAAPINGLQWGHTRCYANRLLDGNDVYHGWLIKEHKKLSFTDWDIFGPAKICVVDSGSSSQFFERAGPDLYRPAFTGFDELHYESPNSEYVLKTSQGMQWGFYDNNAGNLAGCLKFIQDPYGRRTEAIYDSSGRLESFGDVFENAFLYAYDGSGLLESVTLVVDGDEVRRARYEYGTSANDLKFAYVEEKSDLVSGWAIVRTTFYRYHEPSVYQQRLKDVIRGRSFVNMVAAYGDPEMIYDSTLAEHAVARLEYDAEGRVSSLKIRGTDDPEEHYAYEYVQLEVPSSSINIVHTQTVEKGPYNAEKTMYSNYAGQLVLSRLRDGSSSTSPDWYEYVTYNDRFQVLEVAKPSAIESADVSMTPSSLNWSITLKSEGLVHYREYHEENEFSSEPERIVRRSHIVYPSGRTLEYQYDSGSISDALNRVAGLNGYAHNPSTGIITLGQFEYMGSGTPTKNTFPEPNLRHSWKMQPSEAVEDAGDQYTGYDRFGRVKRSRWFHEGSSLEPLVDLTWNYDRSSNKMQRLDLLAPSLARQDQAAEYDLQSRVTSWARGHYNASAQSLINDGEKEEFTYDRLGNWTNYKVYREAVLDIDQNRVHNEANQIVEVDGKSSKLDYDDNGNMTKFPSDRDLDGNVRKLIWDAWNRLRRVRNSNDVIVDWYGYDGLGRRKWHVYDNNSVYHRHYFYDDQGQIIEEGTHIDNQEDTYKIICQYVWHPGAQGQLIFRDRSVNNNGTLDERLYSLRDDMDVVAIADHSGQLLQRYHYTSFGLQRVMDTDFIELSQEYPSYDWTTLFHGHFLDKGRDIYCIGHRYYRPRLGRWLSQDPAGHVDGPNLYAYVNQNPLNRIDRTGLWAEAGHFYTTYAVALAAGLSQQRAFALAYYSQLPDEVADFEAIEVVEEAGKALGVLAMEKELSRKTFGFFSGPTTAQMDSAVDRVVNLSNIQYGLHFLTGKDEAGIAKARSSLVSAIKDGRFSSDWELGFAIHTLGDAYAHTYNSADGKLMSYKTGKGHLLHGKLPDQITSSAANYAKYADYVANLYTLLGGQGDAASNPHIVDLLKNAANLPKPLNRGTSHERANNAMHNWFVGKYGQSAMYGYNPRPDFSTNNNAGLTIPITGDVNAHSVKIRKMIDQ